MTEVSISLHKPDLIKVGFRALPDRVIAGACHHNEVREIGQEFDKEGKHLRFERCEQCGLLLLKHLTT